jgi:hypothetical protein
MLSGCTNLASRKSESPRLPASGSTVLPLNKIHKNSAGGTGFTIPVTFTDKEGIRITKLLLVDTGSSGLHILKSELPGFSFDSNSQPIQKTYGGGGKFNGEIESLELGFGNLTSQSKFQVDVVDTASCDSTKPNCPYKHGSSDMTWYGYSGIIGLGLRPSGDAVYNPLTQSGITSYILSACSKTLVLNPSTEQISAFKFIQLNRSTRQITLPNGKPAWDDRSVNACYSINGLQPENPCRPTLLDTGVTDLLIAGQLNEQWIDGIYMKPNLDVTVSISGFEDWTFVTKPKSSFASNKSLLLGGFDSILGATFFLDHDVYFDAASGKVGIAKACSTK